MEAKNLKRLRRSSIPMRFIKEMKAIWTHTDWDIFCIKLDEQGFTPIDFDQVGLLLEDIKVDYLMK